MSIFKTPAKVTISKKSFAERFRENLRIVGNVSAANRRVKSILDDETIFPKPKDAEDDDVHTKLSNERERQSKAYRRYNQIILDVGMQIATGLVSKMETSGEIFELKAHDIYEMSGRRQFVQSVINGMTHTDFSAYDPDPFVDIQKKFGELVIIQHAPGIGYIRVFRDHALPADWSMVIHRQLNRAKGITIKADAAYASARRIIDISKKDEPFDESRARYYDAIRNGKIKPIDPPGE